MADSPGIRAFARKFGRKWREIEIVRRRGEGFEDGDVVFWRENMDDEMMLGWFLEVFEMYQLLILC